MAKIKYLEKCKHPNSRKTKALAKQLRKSQARAMAKTVKSIKLNLLGEKIEWFRDNLNPNKTIYSASDTRILIRKYFERFDDELEQVRIKQSIGQRRTQQHANRQNVIYLILKKEYEEYQTCGLEMPDLLNQTQLNLLRSWNGELRYIQNFKLKRIRSKFLDELETKQNNADS